MPSHQPPAVAARCPCGSDQAYQSCCGRYHAGQLALQATDPQQLMRSRYSAYVLRLTDYLLATWHPTTRPATLDADPPALRWLGLEVRSSGPSMPTMQGSNSSPAEAAARPAAARDQPLRPRQRPLVLRRCRMTDGNVFTEPGARPVDPADHPGSPSSPRASWCSRAGSTRRSAR